MHSGGIDRRSFLERTVSTGAALTLAGLTKAQAATAAGGTRRNRSASASSVAAASRRLFAAPLGVSVRRAGQHLRHHSRAGRNRAKEFKIANHYPHIDKMLAGRTFDLLVNTTDMQEHEHLNREAIAAGKHIWSEKPIANSLAAGQEILERPRRKASASGAPRSSSPARSSRSWPRRSPPARSAASPRPTPITATQGPTGRRSSTKKAAAACPISASTT